MNHTEVSSVCADPERILIIQLKKIGDLILTLPAIMALRQRYPNAEIKLLTTNLAGSLAPCFTGIDEVITFPTTPAFRLWRKLRSFQPDLAFDFSGTLRSALMAKFSRCQHIIGFERPVRDRFRRLCYQELVESSVRDRHTLDYHLDLVRKYTQDASSSSACLGIPPEISQKNQSFRKSMGITSPYLLIHAGTAWEKKYWMPERWAEIINWLHSRSYSVILTGGQDQAEIQHIEQIIQQCDLPPHNLAGKCTLPELADHIHQAQSVFGVDTAAMHLAAMFHKPQVVLFGPTNPYHWRPLHSLFRIVLAGQPSPFDQFSPRHTHAPMSEITVEAVLSAIQTLPIFNQTLETI